MSMSELLAPNSEINLGQQGMLLMYRRVVALGLGCIVAATALWEFPFPRSLLLQAGFFLVVSGFVLFTIVAIIGELSELSETMGHLRLFVLMPIYTLIVLLVILAGGSLIAGAHALTELRVCSLSAEVSLCTKKFPEYSVQDRVDAEKARKSWKTAPWSSKENL